MTHLLVVGAGPAGRALAHRALVHGLTVTVVDPDPDRAWTATIGAFADDLPEWLPSDVIASRTASFVVYVPQRREIPRAYCILAPGTLQEALSLGGATLIRRPASEVTAHSVRLDDGSLLVADTVVDARGSRPTVPTTTSVARQRAHGTVVATSHPPEMVLMDWRHSPADAPSFNYRVDLGNGRRLIEETCLAGAPATSIDELARRNAAQQLSPGVAPTPGATTVSSTDAEHECVDFPLHDDPTPWRAAPTRALKFGAGGGLMHPATGYSIAESLDAADRVAWALARGKDARATLWPRSARLTYRLRMLGLGVILGFDGPALTAFFDAFFGLPIPRQRAYLNGRWSARDTAATMWAIFIALPARRKMALAKASMRAAASMVCGRPCTEGPRCASQPHTASGRTRA